MAEVTFHELARVEFEQALEWYLDRSPQSAARFILAFEGAVEAIESRPATFPFCDELHRSVRLERYPYNLIYEWDGRVAFVIAMAHTSRRSDYWSDRDPQ